MKLLIITEYYPPTIMGGGETNIALVAAALAKQGVDVSVLTSHQGSLPKYERKDDVQVYRRLTTGNNPGSISSNLKRSTVYPKSVIKEATTLAEEKQFDRIHFIGNSILAAKELRKLGIPLVATIESYIALCPKGDRMYHGKSECTLQCSMKEFLSCQKNSTEIGKMRNSALLKYNPAALTYLYNHYKKLNKSLQYCNLIAISEYIRNLLLQHGHQSTVIPNAIDVDKFNLSPAKENTPMNVLYLGAFIRSKGPHILLDAIKGVDCQLDMYGKGNMKDALQKRITEKGYNATIHDPVLYDKIPQIYANADVIVFPSMWPEPFGRIAIEAMAAGKPIIGSAIGGINETIADGCGITVEPGNVDQLRDALRILQHDPELRNIMGKKGKIAVTQYKEETVIETLIAYYQTLPPVIK